MKRLAVLTLITAIAALTACNDSTGPGGNAAQVSLSFTAGAAGAPAAASGLFAGPADFTFSDGQNELIITKAEVVLREIELERVEVVDCDVAPEPEGCEDFEIGPMLLDLALDGSVDQSVTIAVDPGTYDELEFDIHKVSGDDPADEAFATANPDLVDVSIRVQGTYNGVAFTYVTDLNEEQEYDLVPPLVIEEDMASSTNVTVRLDLAQWFRDPSGNLIDPVSANKGGVNEDYVKDTIRDSIEAFEDDDRDGDDDQAQ